MALYEQTKTIANGNSADGGEVNTEIVNLGASVNSIVNAQINDSAAIDISKTTLGTFTDWTNYTPTWDSTGGPPDIGNGSISGSYTQIGKMCNAVISFSPGSTTNFTGTEWTFSIPVTASGTGYVGSVWALDSGVGYKTGVATLITTTTISVYNNGISESWGNTTNIPMAGGWAAADRMRIQITFKVA